MRFLIPLLLLAVMGCTMQTPSESTAPTPAATPTSVAAPGPKLSTNQAARNFVSVVEQMEPVVEQACTQLTEGLNCDFRIVIDDRPGQGPNAFQTLDKNGRPILGFTLPLIVDVRNKDELAFVLGHEAAHHIRNHLARQRQSAMAGAAIFGILAAGLGGGSGSIDAAQQIGATVGARSYSKEFELEADQLGALLTQRAGYDAIKGAQYFIRIPDPGNRFLGTHPPNAARIETVRRAVGK